MSWGSKKCPRSETVSPIISLTSASLILYYVPNISIHVSPSSPSHQYPWISIISLTSTSMFVASTPIIFTVDVLGKLHALWKSVQPSHSLPLTSPCSLLKLRDSSPCNLWLEGLGPGLHGVVPLPHQHWTLAVNIISSTDYFFTLLVLK